MKKDDNIKNNTNLKDLSSIERVINIGYDASVKEHISEAEWSRITESGQLIKYLRRNLKMMNRFYNNGYFGNGYCGGYGVFHNGLGFLIGIVILVTIALLFYHFVHNNKKRASSDAAEILKMKYVQGEISEEEYMRRKSVIEK